MSNANVNNRDIDEKDTLDKSDKLAGAGRSVKTARRPLRYVFHLILTYCK